MLLPAAALWIRCVWGSTKKPRCPLHAGVDPSCGWPLTGFGWLRAITRGYNPRELANTAWHFDTLAVREEGLLGACVTLSRNGYGHDDP